MNPEAQKHLIPDNYFKLSWYRSPLSWLRGRVRITHLHREHVVNQRKRSLYLLVFGVVRIIGWTILAVLIGLGLAHAGGFDWSRKLAESLPFVVMISIYANWATDLDAATAAFAALVAADGHAASITNRQILAENTAGIEEDIARLALMTPCPEATALADDIRRRLTARMTA